MIYVTSGYTHRQLRSARELQYQAYEGITMICFTATASTTVGKSRLLLSANVGYGQIDGPENALPSGKG